MVDQTAKQRCISNVFAEGVGRLHQVTLRVKETEAVNWGGMPIARKPRTNSTEAKDRHPLSLATWGTNATACRLTAPQPAEAFGSAPIIAEAVSEEQLDGEELKQLGRSF